MMVDKQVPLPLREPSSDDERRAVVLYAIMARDFCDFLDMIAETDTTTKSLEVLLKMLKHERPQSDVELNRLGVGPVERELERRRAG
jgi:hypothetical protein